MNDSFEVYKSSGCPVLMANHSVSQPPPKQQRRQQQSSVGPEPVKNSGSSLANSSGLDRHSSIMTTPTSPGTVTSEVEHTTTTTTTKNKSSSNISEKISKSTTNNNTGKEDIQIPTDGTDNSKLAWQSAQMKPEAITMATPVTITTPTIAGGGGAVPKKVTFSDPEVTHQHQFEVGEDEDRRAHPKAKRTKKRHRHHTEGGVGGRRRGDGDESSDSGKAGDEEGRSKVKRRKISSVEMEAKSEPRERYVSGTFSCLIFGLGVKQQFENVGIHRRVGGKVLLLRVTTT